MFPPRAFRAVILSGTVGALLGAAPAAEREVTVGDAFARSSADGQTWTIGTGAAQLTFTAQGGPFRLTGFQNKLVEPSLEYVDPRAATAPFSLASQLLVERFSVQVLWSKALVGRITADPGADNLRVAVKKGEMIGFCVGPHGDYAGDQVRWPATIEYADGPSFRSADEAKVPQGPIWYYYIQVPGTGAMELIDSVEFAENVKENFRIPSQQSGRRAPGLTPHVGATVLHPSPEFDAVRVWRAPQDGTVTVRARAEHVGYGDVDLSVLKIVEKPADAQAAGSRALDWKLRSAQARQTPEGGRPAVQLEMVLTHEELEARLCVVAYPGVPVFRQSVELENHGRSDRVVNRPACCYLPLSGDRATEYVHSWMVGGNSQRDQGKMHSAPVTAPYEKNLEGRATHNYVPWIALCRQGGPRDGLFLALEYLGQWNLAVRTGEGVGSRFWQNVQPDGETYDRKRLPTPFPPLVATAAVADVPGRRLPAGGKLALPAVTLGVFKDDLDDMARRLYDWQYEYLWDYTNDDWYGRMQFTTAWWADSHNLQEQFAGRLAHLDMDWTEYMREAGLDALWDDAGWSADPNIWACNREGPDFAQTVRFVAKTGMKWVLWFPGDPGSGIMDTKVGSWGDFQWRTDALGFNFARDRAFRDAVTRFLRTHPRCSWHTCSGGSTYSHTFDVQRYGDVHYDTDGPGSDITNYYFSYLETPDKAFDNLATWSGRGVFYNPDTGRRMLSMVPKWGLYIRADEIAQMRRITDLYRYLWREGVAGRWSYVTHPPVKGDTEHYYCQRLSYDRTKSLIILKHRASGDVTIFPRGLLPDREYLVEFESGSRTATRAGADLMAGGITIKDQQPGELVYLNLPGRPGSGRDKTPPAAPGRVLARRETNLGFCGVGVYWSAGVDDQWVSHYEVRRDGRLLGKACTGTYFFDRAPGWNPQGKYEVRTVDGDGNNSPWSPASPLADEPLSFSVLGGHFAESGREGWKAETSADRQSFSPMAWVPPARPPSADLGGTPNQPGGAEGYWEGAGKARLGRGWQLASPEVACVRTWTAPRAGTVRIAGRVMKEYYHRSQGGPLRAQILHNQRQVWPAQDWAMAQVGDLTGAAHDLNLAVAAGDTLRFVLDKGTSAEHDLLAWMPRILYVDASASRTEPHVVRILCGASQPYTDRLGNVWSADTLATGGRPAACGAAIEGATPTPDDQPLYQAGRAGQDFSYAIPLPPGLYSLRLKFAEPTCQWFFERPFHLDINGRRVLQNFDSCQAARGPRRAYERVFRYLVPGADGQLRLRFTAGWEPRKTTDEALVQAIEILPEDKSLVRIDAGAENPFVDWNGFVWEADGQFEGGRILRADVPVTQASPTLHDQRLYQTARAGQTITYRIPVTPGLYAVHLKFAELWLKEQGKRPLDIEVGGRTVWKSWDPATAAEKPGIAADLRVDDITPDRAGRITIRISAAGDEEAILQAIEIE